MKKILPFLLVFQSCTSTEKLFSSRRNITGNYYLVESEDRCCKICYTTSICRNPIKSRVLAYTIKDSLMIMKIQLRDSSVEYHVINMNRDRVMATEKEYLAETITAANFSSSWLGKSRLKFTTVRH